MKRNRLWIAAPLLALSLFAVPMNEVEAAEQVLMQSEALFVNVMQSQSVVLSNVITEDEAVKQIRKDLEEYNASTAFTLTYKKGEDIEAKVQNLFNRAKETNEYIYGSSGGYGLSAIKSETEVMVVIYHNYYLLDSDFNSFYVIDKGENQEKVIFNEVRHAEEVERIRQKEQEITSYVKNVAEQIFQRNMTDFEKVKAAYDYIILNTTYGTTTTVGYGKGNALYSIFKQGTGVSQAYALLFQRLMEEANIESKYIIGSRVTENGAHEKHDWNMVTINGQTYYIDTAYGDPRAEHLSDKYISYRTFLVTEEQMKSYGHVIREQRPYIKPISNIYKAWHEVSEPIILGDFMYYTLLEGIYKNDKGEEYGKYTFKQANVNYKTGALKSNKLIFSVKDEVRDVSAVNPTVFNNKLFFANYNDGARLWFIDELGIHELKRDLYENGTVGIPQIGEIKVVNNELLVYDYTEKDKIVYREQKEERRTLQQIEEVFSSEHTVNSLKETKSEDSFRKLMRQLSQYIHSTSNNKQFIEFQNKVTNFRSVQQELVNTTTWGEDFSKVINPVKPWQIKFTEELAEIDKIYITNIFNEKLPAKITVKDNIVTVTPEKAYDKGGTYYLIIPEGVTSVSGVTLSEAISVPFTYE